MFLTRLKQTRFLCIKGLDSEKFLQTLITQDIRNLNQCVKGLPSLFLDKDGKIDCEAIVSKPPKFLISADYIIDHSKSATINLLKKLRKFSLTTQVTIHDISSQLAAYQIFPCNPGVQIPFKHISKLETYLKSKAWLFPDVRKGNVLGYKLYTCHDSYICEKLLTRKLDFSIRSCEEKTFSDCRLRVGVVEKHDLINSKNQAYNCLPTHYNFDWLGYIDREKKCYMGGEIISRALNTLVQRQRLVLFHLNAPISQIPRWLHLYRQEKTCKFPVVVLGVQTIGIILNCRRLARDLGSDMFTDSSFSVTTPQSYMELLYKINKLKASVTFDENHPSVSANPVLNGQLL